MPEQVHETIVNDRISQLLNKEFGIDSRAERTTLRKRPDIIITSKGLLIGIESSYSKADAERDALERIRQRRADLVLALWLSEQYSGLTEDELDDAVRRSKFDVKVFTETLESLDPYLPQQLKAKLTPEGWFSNIGLSDIKEFIDNAADFLIKEEQVTELSNKVKEETYYFVRAMSSVDRNGEFAEKLYDLFWKLYGLSLGRSPAEISEVIFGQTALSILLSSAFYEHARDYNPDFTSLGSRISDPINGLRNALEDLLKIDYKVALKTTIEILKLLPNAVAERVRDLCELGITIAQNKALLKRDFAGRVYHEITGDLALKKGFATFYTEIPAAYLLVGLAFDSLLSTLSVQEQVRILSEIKTADFACGSGTLLTSSVHYVDRLASKLKFYEGVDLDLDFLTKHVIEDGTYGIDALRYASQITAINLALMCSHNLKQQNVYSVHLGFIKRMNKYLTWLGSLELLKNGGKFAGILAWIEGGLHDAVERISIEDIQAEIALPSNFDMITMNPPFTRATGRTKKLEPGRNAFFGFIADEESREKVKDSYENMRDDVRRNLIKIAQDSKEFPKYISDVIQRKNSDLEQYLGMGQAGEGLMFLYLAYKFIRLGGVIGFVLPRTILSGVHWFVARTLLASKFHLKYVVISSDSNGYNFSESTSLSEALVIAKRIDEHSNDEETVFVSLLTKPKGSFDAITLVDRICESAKRNISFVSGSSGITGMLNKVTRSKLLEQVDNWNRFLAVSDIELSNEILRLIKDQEILIGKHAIRVKLVRFTDLISTMGVNRRGTIIEAFDLPVKGNRVDCSKLRRKVPNSYSMICGGGSELRKCMSIRPNAYVMRGTKLADTIIPLMSRLLVPYRIRWDTARVIAMRSDEPVLSNMFFMTQLNVDKKRLIDAEKALVVWLNSVWGLLVILANREETEGAFTGLNLGNWRLLPVLDVANLSKGSLKKLAKIFDDFCNSQFPRLPEQFSKERDKVDRNRLNLDIQVLKALDPKMNQTQATESLLKLYGTIHAALDSWIKGVNNHASDEVSQSLMAFTEDEEE